MWPASRPFLRIYDELHGERDQGMGFSGMRPTDVFALARVYGVEDGLAWRMVRACSAAWRAAIAAPDEDGEAEDVVSTAAAPSRA